jgi:hypothetical protein
MNAQEMLTFIMIFLGFFAMVFGIVYMNKKENLAMIEKGMNPKDRRNRPMPTPYKNLKWGLLLVGAGMGLLVAFLIAHNTQSLRGDEEAPIYFALIAVGGGLGLVGSFLAEKKELLYHRQQVTAD